MLYLLNLGKKIQKLIKENNITLYII